MLTNSQHLLQSIVQYGIIMLDTEGLIKYVNPFTETLTGYAVNELINKPFSILYTDNTGNQADYDLSSSLKNGNYVSQSWKLKKDNSSYWAEIALAPAFDEGQNLIGHSCVIRDLTEQKKTEWKLKDREERFRTMVEGVKDYGIFMLDAEGHIITWNDGAEKIKGYKKHEIIGKHFSIFYTLEDLQSKKPERELKIAVQSGKYEEEGWRVRKNGSLFWANIVITALFNEQNDLIGFSKVTRDLTERKEAEERLRQSEERSRLLIEQVKDYGIFMMDDRGRIISWNEGARRIKGYTAEEIVGKYFSIFYTEDDKLNGKPAMELRVAREEGKYEEEGWRVRKDGSKFWANIVVTPIFLNGALIGYSKVTRDLTERKEAERALKRSYEQVKILAGELQVTNEELASINNELEQFSSIVSHDLQEPVRTIKSFLQLIEQKLDSDNEDLRKYIRKAVGAADRMRELIRNLLHYSQIGKTDPVFEMVSLEELFQEVVQNLKTMIEAANAEIDFEHSIEYVVGDRMQLSQLLQNLLSNALKFTAADKPRIKIKCTREGSHFKFSVVDNGIGIEKADLDKIFEVFKRLHTKKEYPGTGIGLAICKKIVDRHNGQIWPESEPGKGTTFHFTIETIEQAEPLE